MTNLIRTYTDRGTNDDSVLRVPTTLVDVL